MTKCCLRRFNYFSIMEIVSLIIVFTLSFPPSSHLPFSNVVYLPHHSLPPHPVSIVTVSTHLNITILSLRIYIYLFLSCLSSSYYHISHFCFHVCLPLFYHFSPSASVFFLSPPDCVLRGWTKRCEKRRLPWVNQVNTTAAAPLSSSIGNASRNSSASP